jgi:uncharacterized membrane protein
MSASRRLANCLQVLLAAAMVLSTWPIAAQAAPYIQEQQTAEITGDYGAAAPHGTWTKMREVQTFYLHNDQSNPPFQPADPRIDYGNVWYDTNMPGNAGTYVQLGEWKGQDSQCGSTAPTASKPMCVPGSPRFGSKECLGAGGPAQIPPLLDDTAVFRVKANFWGQVSDLEEQHFLVDFIDIHPAAEAGFTANCRFPDTVATSNCNQGSSVPTDEGCRFARVRVDLKQGAIGQSILGGSAAVYPFESPWVEVCAPLGGNRITPNCSSLYGYTIPRGHGIGIMIHAQSDDECFAYPFTPCPDDLGNIVMAFDDPAFPSNFQVDSDSVRINQWTQDRLAAPTNNFPPGRQGGVVTNAQDRTMNWHAVQFNTWGHGCGVVDNTGADQPYNNCDTSSAFLPSGRVFDGIEEFATFFRVRDLTANHTGAGYCRFAGDFCYNQFLSMDQTLGLIGTDPGQDPLRLRCCNQFNRPIQKFDDLAKCVPNPYRSSINPNPTCTGDNDIGLQRYAYQFTYPSTMKDGTYQVEFQDEGHGWNAPYIFHIGGSGFDFRFHADEPRVSPDRTIADHLVALGESTKYSMLITNNGVTTDTYSVSVPTPGSGWTATVSPTTVTIPPKGEAKVDVTIVPPASARAGDIKVVSVAVAPAGAVSAQLKTLYTRTTYTAQEVHGVFLTTPMPYVELRPGVAKLGPVVIHNNGTVRDSFVLTTSGLPAGWQVSLNPTFLQVQAASREDLTLNVRADPAARGGQSYTLQVRACLTEDKTVCDTLDIPVRIFEVNAVSIETLPPLGLQCWTSETPSATPQEPGNVPGGTVTQHLANCSRITMRDGERDFFTSSGDRGNRDTKFDDSMLFRIKVSNDGDKTDRIHITGAWDPPVYHNTNSPVVDTECDGRPDGDGVPDGWRFRILGGPPAGTPSGNPFIPYASGPTLKPQNDPGMLYPRQAGDAAPPPRIAFNSASATWSNWASPQYGIGQRNGAGAFSGDYDIGFITLPPQTAQYVYVELGWVEPAEGTNPNVHLCTHQAHVSGSTNFDFREHLPSPNAYYRFSWRSGNEASLRGSMLLHGHLAVADNLVPGDTWNSRTAQVNNNGEDSVVPNRVLRGVLLERGIGQPDEELAPIGTSTPWATFNLVATNIGTEYDNLKIDVDDGKNDWTHTLLANPVASAGTGIIDSGASPTQPTPNTMPPCAGTPPTCTARINRGPAPGGGSMNGCIFTDPSNKHMVCNGMGVYDAVNFQAQCRPPSYVRPGDYNDMTITVTSDRADRVAGSNVFSRMTVRCIAQAEYSFNAENPNHDLTGYIGQTIAFPVTIHNTGLAPDRYFLNVDAHIKPDGKPVIDLKKDPWNPQTSAGKGIVSGAVVEVPPGLRWHGFLSVTVPDKDENGDATEVTAEGPQLPGGLIRQEEEPRPDHHFRLMIQSLDGPGHQSQVLDFTAIVVDTPVFTVSADPVTIASPGMDRIRIKAIDCEPGGPVGECNSTGLNNVEFHGLYLSVPRKLPPLPRGFEFTCLQGDTDKDTYSDHQEIVGTQAPSEVPPGWGLPATAWSDPAVKPPVPPQPFTIHPNFDKFRGCYVAPEPIPQDALPSTGATSCYPDQTAPPTQPPCGAYEYHVTPTFAPDGTAIQQLEVKVPENQLGTSRVAHRIQASATKGSPCEAATGRNCYVTYTDAIINMRSSYGVALNVTDEAGDCGHGCKVVPPGRNALGVGPTGILYDVTVTNTGLNPQSVLLSNSALQPGWQIFYESQSLQVQPPGYQMPECNPVGSTEECQAACTALPCQVLGPQDREHVKIGILAPENAQPGAQTTVLIFATVQEDPTQVATLQLTAKVGQYGVSVDASPATYYVGPDEPARFRVEVTNTGDVKANLDLTAILPAAIAEPEATKTPCNLPSTSGKFRACLSDATEPSGCNYESSIQTVPSPDPFACYIDAIEPGETRTVILEVKVPPAVNPTGNAAPYKVTLDVRSRLFPLAYRPIERDIRVLDFAHLDVDRDGAEEYAVDGCTVSMEEGCLPDATDGYDSFREAACACGTVSRSAPLAQFLDDDAREAKSTAGDMRGESYWVDGNNDGHADHFIDINANGMPDLLWIPDKAGNRQEMRVAWLNFTRDVTGDQLPELFLDLGEGRWSKVFDLARGQFYPLIQVYVDEDNVIDYVIDFNGNGKRDLDETVLLGGTDGLVHGVIFLADMTGDGVFDQAFDLKGSDGIPEYFFDGRCDSATKACSGFEVEVRDVTGDGQPDWTFDSSGKNGRPDAYYDPKCADRKRTDPQADCQVSGRIDTQAQFMRDLGRYAWVLVLFGVALILFVALLVVTRRR